MRILKSMLGLAAFVAVMFLASWTPGTVTAQEEPEPFTISVVKDADGAGALDFDFTITGQPAFDLNDDKPRTFEVAAGTYTIDELGEAGWVLVDIDCFGIDPEAITDEDINDGDVTVTGAEGDSVLCIFTNRPAPTATPAPTSTPTATPAPAPTATPIVLSSSVVTLCEGTTLVTRTNGVVTSSQAKAPACAPTIVTRTITPPSTGDAGLLD